MDARQRDSYIIGRWAEDKYDEGDPEFLDAEVAQEAQDSAEELGYGDEITTDEGEV